MLNYLVNMVTGKTNFDPMPIISLMAFLGFCLFLLHKLGGKILKTKIETAKNYVKNLGVDNIARIVLENHFRQSELKNGLLNLMEIEAIKVNQIHDLIVKELEILLPKEFHEIAHVMKQDILGTIGVFSDYLQRTEFSIHDNPICLGLKTGTLIRKKTASTLNQVEILFARASMIMAKQITGIDHIDVMSGTEFEEFISRLLSKNSYQVNRIGGAGDRGVDLVARKAATSISVQCKRLSTKTKVASPDIMKLIGGSVNHKTNLSMIVTTSQLTDPALTDCKLNKVIVWNREKLLEEVVKAKLFSQSASLKKEIEFLEMFKTEAEQLLRDLESSIDECILNNIRLAANRLNELLVQNESKIESMWSLISESI